MYKGQSKPGRSNDRTLQSGETRDRHQRASPAGNPRHGAREDETKARGRRLWQTANTVALFACFFVYVLVRIRPELFYQQDPALFLFDGHFFAGFLRQPGGLVEYASTFLSELFVFGWLATLVVTLLALVICLATRSLGATIAGDGGQAVFLIPAVLILMPLGQYSHPVTFCVGLVVALVIAGLYVRTGRCRARVRLLFYAACSAVVYSAAAGFFVVFAGVVGIFELGVTRNRWLGWLYLVSAGVIPVAVGGWVLDLSWPECFRGIAPPPAADWLAAPSSKWTVLTIRIAFVLLFPLAAGAFVWRRRRNREVSRSAEHDGGGRLQFQPPKENSGATAPIVHCGRRPSWLRPGLVSAALVLVAAGADVAFFDTSTRRLLEIASSVEQRRWSDVLDHARRLARTDLLAFDVRVVADVNRALYFRGELLDDMFAYPQALNSPGLALTYESATVMARLTPRQSSDILFDLGRINEAGHMAYEFLGKAGEQAQILQRLAYIHVLKGEPEAARRFLSVLERSLWHRGWARRCQQQLDADPLLAADPEVASRRDLMVTRDSIDDTADLEKMLHGLLERNPRNRMAVEYLLAHYLLTRQLDKLAANLPRLDQWGDGHLPRHCEEALLIHVVEGDRSALERWGRRIRQQAWQRFERFLEIQRQSRTDSAAAFRALYPEFRDSYFFAYVFGHNFPTVQPAEPPS